MALSKPALLNCLFVLLLIVVLMEVNKLLLQLLVLLTLLLILLVLLLVVFVEVDLLLVTLLYSNCNSSNRKLDSTASKVVSKGVLEVRHS